MYNKKNRNKKLNVNVNNKYLHQRVIRLESELETSEYRYKAMEQNYRSSIKMHIRNSKSILDQNEELINESSKDHKMGQEWHLLNLISMFSIATFGILITVFNIKFPVSTLMFFGIILHYLILPSAYIDNILSESKKHEVLWKWIMRVVMAILIVPITLFNAPTVLILFIFYMYILYRINKYSNAKRKEIKKMTKEIEDKYKKD